MHGQPNIKNCFRLSPKTFSHGSNFNPYPANVENMVSS